MQVNYGIIAIPREDVERIKTIPHEGENFYDDLKVDILHFVAYESVPTLEAYLNLYAELAQDDAHGLVGRDFVLVQAPLELISKMKAEVDSMSDEYLDELSKEY